MTWVEIDLENARITLNHPEKNSRSRSFWTEEDFPLLKSYAQTYSYNQTSIEDGKKAIGEFISQESLDPSALSDGDFIVNYPFLTLLPTGHWAPWNFYTARGEILKGFYVGATVILNLCTGKVMIAALTDFNVYGLQARMLYPDWQPPPGARALMMPLAAFLLLAVRRIKPSRVSARTEGGRV